MMSYINGIYLETAAEASLNINVTRSKTERNITNHH